MIITETAGDVVTLRLDKPSVMNAMNASMAMELRDKLVRAAGEARALVLAGSDRAFCTGADLSGGSKSPGAVADFSADLRDVFNPLMQAIRDCRVPVISAVRGAAAGIGASVALACDMIVAGESAYFLQAFRRVGLVPDGGAAFLLAKSVGRVRAMELMLLGEKLPAATALSWGLVNRVVPDAEVETVAADLARSLAQGPTVALGLIRQSAWAALSQEWEAQLSLECHLQDKAGASADYKEGVKAFLEKRKSNFTGN